MDIKINGLDEAEVKAGDVIPVNFTVTVTDDSATKKFIAQRISEALVQFDITMHHVNRAIAFERDRCAKVAISCTEATADGRAWGDYIADKIRIGQ